MCGIIYYHTLRRKAVGPKIYKRYMKQRSRGTEGFGVYRPLTDQMAHNTNERKAIKHLRSLPDNILMFHHRNPTSPVKNVKNACHPFSTKDFFKRNYILIHNGVINNKFTLFEKHKKLDIEYVSLQPDGRTYCDSEALLWEVALYLEGKIDKIEATGSVAFICYSHENGNNAKLYYYHNRANPLVFQQSRNSLSLASTGNGTNVPEDQLFQLDYVTGKTTQTKLEIASWASYNQSRQPASTSHNNSPYTPGSTAAKATSAPNVISGPADASDPFKSQDDVIGDGDSDNFGALDDIESDILNKALLAYRVYRHTPNDMSQNMSQRFNDLYMAYLREASGIFDVAEMFVLADIDYAEASNDTDLKQLLELIADMIDKDEYYLDANSIHPSFVPEFAPDGLPSDSIGEKEAKHAQMALIPQQRSNSDVI